MQKKLILASSSRYRRELLDRLGLEYDAESPDIDESSRPGETPKDTALRLSEMKAHAIWEKHPGSVVIGSDQVADLNGTKLGKPHTRERAIEQLTAMQGNVVVFYTALCVIDAEGRAEKLLSPTTIRMRSLKRETIEAYVDREKPFDCAGAAKIEKLGIALMASVESDDPTSLIGLPLMKLTTLLANAGVEVLPGLAESA
ncbi:septum formation protein Maf [Sutterella massiliensis]|uniref:7-methyl-GTP pyrophosphatase n=1 Tax=Sutterella massiliensis TaxID=1816689 RepID=A0ABS2DT98_9BURK|nr:Maf family nucleotide pyrophosphatase [Sutterella massiliensis]MBM6704527.1 septum formation protein Maf [Sutterella massiliensis]